jgi:sulfhydrogenase subunit gamma (sulfur reductase)
MNPTVFAFVPDVVADPLVPCEAVVVDRIQEAKTIFTLRLRLTDSTLRQRYCFAPGQFNMLYLFGVGEVAISIVSDPQDETLIDHTIRNVGRVTHRLSLLRPGDHLGLRGPYGTGWPLAAGMGSDILLVTGGLGCAPLVAVINYIILRREQFGRFTIIQGVKHAEDLIWRDRYAYWQSLPDTHVLLAADHGGALWPGHVGRVTELFDQISINPLHTKVMMCGPEAMMRVAAKQLVNRGIAESRIHLSLERNMHCAIGHCGHCQFGPAFVCRDGPIFPYPRVKHLLAVRGL